MMTFKTTGSEHLVIICSPDIASMREALEKVANNMTAPPHMK